MHDRLWWLRSHVWFSTKRCPITGRPVQLGPIVGPSVDFLL